ncbi:MAG: SDR family oxidoreductase [Sulfitobacter sp.]|jgi:3-oxoacyl-[acyl-carrier protein] reductase|uniref:3-oxoacyl-[acyl-carrier-protein] reductase FabG n=1 Tax=Pseudosulfitobacter pseudonitzschiae TaxID=1402135 RepID=A0A221K924_9RHOB|nr:MULTISPECIES: SDR family oxidoreductase [Roseobacteraceae]ASM75370.1 3-oxoacyl-[acyl-carrier-protein] reductase FabG [Pseudosulfitobacter pseudonitzschiae]MCX8225101.1 SDR family oxidoreductase [Sulfitobacter sp.]|tara:strand:+ start:305 stop:1135 length:831 start_codon:yes stop_codon:yes gene_type:complete
MTARLDGRVALVSGSGRGIGREIALKLASEGARIVVNDLDADPAAQTAEMIRDMGGEAAICAGSVTEDGFAQRFVDTGVNAFGGLDIIVNNAGYTWDSVVQKMTDEQWHAIIDVHLTAPFQILRAAAPVFRDKARAEAEAGQEVFRKVVNISSIAGTGGNAGQINYSAAKAGIIGLTRTMAKEWGRYKVNVNAVAFGPIRTRLTEGSAKGDSTIKVEGKDIRVGVSPDLLSQMETSIPLGRVGTPEEAAGAVYLFCAPESNFISGQYVICGGGFVI